MTSVGTLASVALEASLDALAPSRCAACDARVGWLVAFCPACASTVEPAPAGASGPMAYGGAVAWAIMRMKYESRPDLARPLGDLLYRWMIAKLGDWRDAIVVPVPLHASRLAERGFNQSALLGARIARLHGAEFVPRALLRTRETSQQATLDRAGRVDNVAGAFRARALDRLRGRLVILVDDVSTTGATLDACSRVAIEAGAAGVHRVAVAISTPGVAPL